MLNTIVLMGLLLAVVGKIVGIAFVMRSENPTTLPFTVLVTAGYAMLIGGSLAGGSFTF